MSRVIHGEWLSATNAAQSSGAPETRSAAFS